MSCEDCGDDLSVNDGDPVTEITITGDDSQVIVDPVTLEVGVCDDEVGLVEVDGGIVLFEEDAEVEVVVFDDVLEILECGETTSGGGGAVDSVNAYTGTVVLDPDDLDDTSTTNKFTNTTDISRLANTSGTNTGDQDLSGKQDVLVSGTNIKTINGSSILGAGDLTLSTGSTGLALADQEYTSTYVYVGMDSGAGWQIYRRTRTTNVRQYASGVSDYSTAWTNRVGLIYS